MHSPLHALNNVGFSYLCYLLIKVARLRTIETKMISISGITTLGSSMKYGDTYPVADPGFTVRGCRPRRGALTPEAVMF